MRNTVLFAATALLAGCATAGTGVAYPAVDTNNDGRVTSAEFAAYVADADTFNRYDTNNDRALSSAEYRAGVGTAIRGDAYFRGFDRDRSGTLSDREFAEGIFGVYDVDRSGSLSEAEFRAAVSGLTVEP